MLTVTAYKMGPNYTRPETTRGESWRIAPGTSPSIANLPWAELLKDPALHRGKGEQPDLSAVAKQFTRMSTGGFARDRTVKEKGE